MDRRTALSFLGSGLTAGFLPWSKAVAGDRELRGYIRTNWSHDPFTYGSYSYVAKGARQQDRRLLEEPVEGRIFFAGEAIYPHYNSTVHAAYESGIRTGDFVLDTDHRRIAIIGAGVSGLAAAQHLSKAGRDVSVLEARDRTGGRVWTSDELGVPLDLGASWIQGTRGNPLTQIADRLSLPRVETGDDSIVRGHGGRLIEDREIPDWIDNVVWGQHSAGANYSQINLDAYRLQNDYGGKEVVFLNGYNDIFQALDGPYDVKLSSPVSDVSLSQSGISITIRNRTQQTFDAVIVTLPLGVLKRETVRFDPPLPPAKRQAIEKFGMGTLDKVYLLFDQPFWDEDVTWIITPENDLPQGHFNQWLNLYPYLGQPVIMAFNGGPPALELAELDDGDIVSRALQALRTAYPRP